MKLDVANYGPGRPPLPDTIAKMNKMLRIIEKSPGIKSAKLAREIGIKSNQCSILAHRLAKKGFVTITKDAEKSLVYRLAHAD